VHHWHANQVGGLGFAPRSDVLFSGGAESVLVKWLDGQPQFLPRIGGGLNLISLFFPVSRHSACRAEWRNCFVLLCACAKKVKNRGWRSASRGLWIISKTIVLL
jgi:hypothetical protein